MAIAIVVDREVWLLPVRFQQVIGDEDLHLVEGSLQFRLGPFKSKDNYSLVRMVLGRFRLLLSVSKKVHTGSQWFVVDSDWFLVVFGRFRLVLLSLYNILVEMFWLSCFWAGLRTMRSFLIILIAYCGWLLGALGGLLGLFVAVVALIGDIDQHYAY